MQDKSLRKLLLSCWKKKKKLTYFLDLIVFLIYSSTTSNFMLNFENAFKNKK